jgi:hypothetical protein
MGCSSQLPEDLHEGGRVLRAAELILVAYREVGHARDGLHARLLQLLLHLQQSNRQVPPENTPSALVLQQGRSDRLHADK